MIRLGARSLALALAFLSLAVLLAPVSVLADPPTLDKIVFIDYAAPLPARTGTSAVTDSCGDSSSFKTMGVKWNAFPVTYFIDASGIGVAGAENAVTKGFDEWNAQRANFFSKVAQGSSAKVTVSWESIDGAGSALAVTTVWYNTLTKVIARATVKFDSGDSWGVLSGAVCYGQGTDSRFDIQDVATHEVGHVTGVGHPASSPRNVPLTMFAYASQGETYKMTLATGDKKALAAIYPS